MFQSMQAELHEYINLHGCCMNVQRLLWPRCWCLIILWYSISAAEGTQDKLDSCLFQLKPLFIRWTWMNFFYSFLCWFVQSEELNGAKDLLFSVCPVYFIRMKRGAVACSVATRMAAETLVSCWSPWKRRMSGTAKWVNASIKTSKTFW